MIDNLPPADNESDINIIEIAINNAADKMEMFAFDVSELDRSLVDEALSGLATPLTAWVGLSSNRTGHFYVHFLLYG